MKHGTWSTVHEREIPRNPEVPALNDEIIRLLTEPCFRRDDPSERVDLIFVFSTPIQTQETADAVTELLRHGIAQRVFVTGGIPGYKDSRNIPKPECALVLDHIPISEFPRVRFFTEDRSRNTLENAQRALEVLDFRAYRKVLFVFKAHAAGRGYLTLRRFLPHAKILQKTAPAFYEEAGRLLERDSWHTFSYGRERVWGEYLRIKIYGERGDIAFDEARNAIEQIQRLVI